MENKKIIKKDFLQRLTEKLSQIGFEKKLNGQTIWKLLSNGKAAAHISFIDHSNDFDLVLNFAVRIDAIEDLKNEVNEYLSAKEKKQTATLGVEYGNLIEGEQQRWTISRHEDIEVVCSEISEIVLKIGIQYFETYSNLETVFSLCRVEDTSSRLHAPIRYTRAMNAVGAAYLLQKPNLQKIINDIYEAYLRNEDDLGLEMFERFTKKIIFS
ncbi:hypothetical protein [Cohnella yongneupensis]|uniref:DUF4304 domain-containing protein n=1 Tax=Cohnella yongneupensis TaxID=425006 RepID=A0ABW0R4K2_9BACL